MSGSIKPTDGMLPSVPKDGVNERVTDAPLPPPPNTPSSLDPPARRRETSATAGLCPPTSCPVTSHPGDPREEKKLDPHHDRGERAPRRRPQLLPGPLSSRPPPSVAFGVPSGGAGATATCISPHRSPSPPVRRCSERLQRAKFPPQVRDTASPPRSWPGRGSPAGPGEDTTRGWKPPAPPPGAAGKLRPPGPARLRHSDPGPPASASRSPPGSECAGSAARQPPREGGSGAGGGPEGGAALGAGSAGGGGERGGHAAPTPGVRAAQRRARALGCAALRWAPPRAPVRTARAERPAAALTPFPALPPTPLRPPALVVPALRCPRDALAPPRASLQGSGASPGGSSARWPWTLRVTAPGANVPRKVSTLRRPGAARTTRPVLCFSLEVRVRRCPWAPRATAGQGLHAPCGVNFLGTARAAPGAFPSKSLCATAPESARPSCQHPQPTRGTRTGSWGPEPAESDASPRNW